MSLYNLYVAPEFSAFYAGSGSSVELIFTSHFRFVTLLFGSVETCGQVKIFLTANCFESAFSKLILLIVSQIDAAGRH